MTTEQLQRIANRLRLDVVEMIHASGDGHPGPCMSIAEILTLLYFEQMRLFEGEPHHPQRDRFILSKGHACPILYATLARKGYFPLEELPKLRTFEGILQGHPDMQKTPGIDSVTGSLGNGVGVGLGMALGMRLQQIDGFVYVVVGDGEQQEGVIWEAAMAAAKHNTGNLIVFGDCNNNQSGGKVTQLSALYPAYEKWQAFHWHVQKVDGHDLDALRAAVLCAKEETQRPSYIECTTVKGKGIPYMEHNNAWHKRTPTEEEVQIAKDVLGGDAAW